MRLDDREPPRSRWSSVILRLQQVAPFVSVLVLTIAASCQGIFEERGPCSGVTCSGHGACATIDDGESAVCVCDSGYFSDGLSCVDSNADGDADTDADGDVESVADADDGDRIEADIEDAQLGIDTDPEPDDENECVTHRGGVCNPILQCGCPENFYCRLGFIFEELCSRGTGGSLGDFERCSAQGQCRPGYACLPSAEFVSSTCLRLCVDESDCARGSECLPIDPMGISLAPYGYCSR